MKSLSKSLKLLRKDKSADEESGSMGFIIKAAITLIVAGLFFWLVVKAMGNFG